MEEARHKGRRWVLSSFEETRNAVAEIASVANRRISIYTPDLESGIYDHDAFLEVAKRLVLSKRYARIRVLISEPTRAVRNGNRFVSLGRRLNTYIEFRNVHEDYRDHREAFLVADDHGLLYRVDAARWEGIADSYEPAVARRYLGLFDEIWNASVVEQELRELRV
jgi:hypothetical protein